MALRTMVANASFGAKAAGLARVPRAWTPTYKCFQLQATDSDPHWTALSDEILDAFKGEALILRSSAVAETLVDRGRFQSYPLIRPNAEAIAAALLALSKEGESSRTRMAVVAQSLVRPVMRGHLSNERRVSKTRNQWQVEVDHPQPDDFRLNSQRDVQPDPQSRLTLRRGDLRRTLGAIGNWAAANFDSRVHMEWVYDHTTLWIVQLDLEDEAPDFGIDPRNIDWGPQGEATRRLSSPLLKKWSEGSFIGFRKIETLPQLQAAVDRGFPPLFVLKGQDASEFLHDPDAGDILRSTVGDRLVGRCDLDSRTRKAHEGLNLPRTDTVSPSEILSFIEETLGILEKSGVPADGVVLIFHAFIPAVSAAWAEADPSGAIVQVDALWGLPDGLQYLDCDVFEYDSRAGALSAEHVPYKGAFLQEAVDGSWSVQQVRRDLARTASMSRDDIAVVAQATLKIAKAAGHRLRVMWFVDIQGRPDLARSIPWFCHRPKEMASIDDAADAPSKKFDRSETRKLPARVVKGPHDLGRVLNTPHRLQLLPTVDHMRENKFLEQVAAYALEGKHSIELRGSGLAHAYYLLSKTGVPIIVPSQRNHLRTRGLRTFGKLVRDGIPLKIQANHEEVATSKVPLDERRRVLLAKLMEEAQEVSESTNRDDLRSELADVLEVLRSLIRHAGFEISEVEDTADAKAKQVGSFDEGVVLLDTRTSEPKGTRHRKRTTLNSRPVRDGNTVTVPHLALVGDAIEISLGGRDVRLSLSTEGLIIEELGPQTDDGQLRLF